MLSPSAIVALDLSRVPLLNADSMNILSVIQKMDSYGMRGLFQRWSNATYITDLMEVDFPNSHGVGTPTHALHAMPTDENLAEVKQQRRRLV